MPKTYGFDDKSLSGSGDFIYAMAQITKTADFNTLGFKITLKENKGQWTVGIEAHSPCDRETHENCHVIGEMERDEGPDYEIAVEKAKVLSEVLKAALGEDDPSLNPVKEGALHN